MYSYFAFFHINTFLAVLFFTISIATRNISFTRLFVILNRFLKRPRYRFSILFILLFLLFTTLLIFVTRFLFLFPIYNRLDWLFDRLFLLLLFRFSFRTLILWFVFITWHLLLWLFIRWLLATIALLRLLYFSSFCRRTVIFIWIIGIIIGFLFIRFLQLSNFIVSMFWLWTFIWILIRIFLLIWFCDIHRFSCLYK